MFSGIVETMGQVTRAETIDGCYHLTIAPVLSFDDLKIGDSVAVNGVCLTVTRLTSSTFAVTVVPETLRLTNLNTVAINDNVNLERSITLNTRIGGHCVQGHIDSIGTILAIDPDAGAALHAKISVPSKLTNYIVPKGYITLDGMSITVIEVTSEWFTVTFIPHTQTITLVNRYRVGTRVNIEVDILGKYIEKLLGVHSHVHSHSTR